MNQFEQKAHDIRIKKLASWEHNIETYSAGKTDWVMVGACGFLAVFALIALAVIYLK